MRVKAVYLAIGITMTGDKDALGLWLAQTEGASSGCRWSPSATGRAGHLHRLRRWAQGFPDAIEAVFPRRLCNCASFTWCHSLNCVSWKRRKEVAADLRRIYTATTAKRPELMLGEFEARWDAEYLPIGQSWRRNWSRLTLFVDYLPEIPQGHPTTNAIESVNMSLRKLTKNRARSQRRGADRCSTWRCATSARSGSCPSGIGRPR